MPYLIAPLLALKTACAALTAYFFIVRFVKDKFYAVLGGILYAFSGFLTYNIFFNHFHEVVVFFPLMLIALEELVINNRKGFFAAAVALNCMVNYWFFIGEVVFVIIYVLIRMPSKEWQFSIKKFVNIAFESILGVMLVMVVLLPSVLTIIGNPRTDADNLLNGWNFWIYWADQRQGAILQSLFFPPDLPSQPNFFPEHQAKWSSMNAWLPMISMSGVIAYFISVKKSWLKRLLIVSFVMAMIPGLNSFFVLLNHSYYARWFYMPILFMSLASVLAYENSSTKTILRATTINTAVILIFTLVIGLTPTEDGETWQIGLSAYPLRFWVYCLVAIVGMIATYLIFYKLRKHQRFKEILISLVTAMAILFSWGYITLGKFYGDDGNFIRDTAIAMRDELITHEDSDEFVRTDIYDSMNNLGMYWGIPNIQAFHSVVPNSIMEFYPYIGVKRDVSSKPETEHYALRSLTSVKWQYVPEGKDDETDSDIYGFKLWGSQNGYNIYENEYYLPMGFGYTRSIYAENPDEKLSMDEMYDTLLLSDLEAVERNKDFATPMEEIPYVNTTPAGFTLNHQEHLALSCYEFTVDNKGFTAKSNLDENVMMFFSVPYEEGWSATLNGEAVMIEKANIGFMAVPVPAGENEIRFEFTPPGIKVGAAVTVFAIFTLTGYLLYFKKQSQIKEIYKEAE